MGAVRRSTEDRRAELADAALQIIATRGVAELSTRSLAEAVGLTTGAIFRHFDSLDTLLVAVAARVVEVLRATYPDPTLPPIEKLELFVEARCTAVGERVGILRLVLSEQFALALPDTARKQLRHAVQETREFLVRTVADAQRAGELRDDVEAAALATVLMGSIQMLALSEAAGGRGRGEVQRVREALRRLLAPAAPGARKAPRPRRVRAGGGR